MPLQITIKRVYETASKEDGYRILVDRLWPRGIKKENAAIDEWAKDIAPLPALRQWFGHNPERWEAFKKAYLKELTANRAIDEFIKSHTDKKQITLVYAAKDKQHTHALILQEFLGRKFKQQQ